jgi:quinol monooxygenase YgiN
MKQILLILVAMLLLPLVECNAQMTINIRYKAENGNACKYVEEMESSGVADKIRAIEGCLSYEYFYPADDPDGLLLIDSWQDQEALNRYHSSPAIQEAAALREKYGLGGRTVRMFTPATPPRRQAKEQK